MKSRVKVISVIRGRYAPSARTACSAVALVLLTGCPMGVVPGGAVLDGNRNGSVSSKPNNSFDSAIAAVFDADRVARLQGTVSERGDLDVFSLGPLVPGDRVIVDASTAGSPLDVTVALFDGNGRLVVNNDDRGPNFPADLDSYVDWITRHASERYYLVVTHSPFASPGDFVGTYAVDVQVTPGFDVPPPVGQILLLDFDGAEITSESLGSFSIEPFDAADIALIYQGQTQTMKDSIRETFEQNFRRFNVTIFTTDDAPLPMGTMFSTVYFGGFNPTAFGISEKVDLYNVDYCDDAVIFTQTFEPHVFSFSVSAQELGVAIGNVGSHEAGHVLGLNHVDDDRALMDDASAADAFLLDQEFMEAPLSQDIMAIGTQDAVLLLDEIVGPLLDALASRRYANRP